MGTSLDSHCNLTARRIPSHLKSLSILKDAESCVKRILALVQTFATGPIRQTAGILIVKDRHQASMQPLHDRSRGRKSSVGIGTTNIVHICATQCAVHLPLPMPQPDSMWWSLSNTIELILSVCFKWRLFNSMLEVIVAMIHWNLISVNSRCLCFCYGRCSSLCIINVSRDEIVKNNLKINGTVQTTVEMIKI